MLGKVLLGVIRTYQRGISPLLPPSCRFTPTCSGYAVEAIEQYGTLHGSWLATKRVFRCHPFGKWGYDPVPSVEGGSGMKSKMSDR